MTLLLLSLCINASSQVKAETTEAKEVLLTGINSCQACGEESAKGGTEPGTKCSIFGHTCTFSVEEATDTEGKEIEELKKKELNYKLNQLSLPLVKNEEYRGARLEIKGKWLKEKGTIEVSSFKKIEK
jgi:hypothetical protein